ncbi:unnamed protein product, partial [Mesorhabditis belari]|uniref:Reticulocalbin-3 n=1 Tax=Mesorhabditis belari TaxID=2138241 RepID=A0AAF3J803_9BILA
MWIGSILFTIIFSSVFGDKERVIDGAGARIQHHHHVDGESDDIDHQAILGSKHQAEEFDQLSPEESQARLKILAKKMDKNGDGYVDEEELTNWIQNSMKSLDDEEAIERMKEIDVDGDNKVSWDEYAADSFPETDITKLDADDRKLLDEDKKYFAVADQDGDGKLNEEELKAFPQPRELSTYAQNGAIDLKEFLGDMHEQPQSEWHAVEKERFANEYDADKDGVLKGEEIRKWLIPDLYQVAVQEAKHLIEVADGDKDGKLSIDEIVSNYKTFVGSEATNYGEDLRKYHEEL